MLAPGDPAPDFTLQADDGSTVSLSDLHGTRVILYFYPSDDTPGCTKQACDIRDNWSAFEAAGARVYGISRDDIASHQAFRAKFQLPFPLLSDPDHAVAEDYGVWVEKTNYGKTSMGINRSAFVVGEDGTIVQALYGVKPLDTSPKALAALAA